MRRREFIGLVGGAAAWPLAAAAQAPERVFRIGWLGNTDAREWAEWRGREFREGLRDLGYIEGKNLRFELRFAEGDDSRLTELAGELAALDVDVIVTHGGGAFAARQATSTIPIVFAAGQPKDWSPVSRIPAEISQDRRSSPRNCRPSGWRCSRRSLCRWRERVCCCSEPSSQRRAAE
jgi:putative tryptophan/tyrosine transport system substrate-binding protein